MAVFGGGASVVWSGEREHGCVGWCQEFLQSRCFLSGDVGNWGSLSVFSGAERMRYTCESVFVFACVDDGSWILCWHGWEFGISYFSILFAVAGRGSAVGMGAFV